MLVKICGITRGEDAEVAVAAGADMVGLVFVPDTPRAVEPTAVAWARELAGAATVGVFRDAPLEQVLEVRDALALNWVQLHGDEPDAWLEKLGPQVLRRVGVPGGVDWDRVAWLGERCLPLIDPGAGDGRAIDWRLLADRPAGIRFGLAGGLTPENVAEAVRLARPDLVDVSSGVEAATGVKDAVKVTAFVGAARRDGGCR